MCNVETQLLRQAREVLRNGDGEVLVWLRPDLAVLWVVRADVEERVNEIGHVRVGRAWSVPARMKSDGDANFDRVAHGQLHISESVRRERS